MVRLRKIGHCCHALGRRSLLNEYLCVISTQLYAARPPLSRRKQQKDRLTPLTALAFPPCAFLIKLTVATVPSPMSPCTRRSQILILPSREAVERRTVEQRASAEAVSKLQRASSAQWDEMRATRGRTRVVRIPSDVLDGAGVSDELADAFLLLCIPKTDRLIAGSGCLSDTEDTDGGSAREARDLRNRRSARGTGRLGSRRGRRWRSDALGRRCETSLQMVGYYEQQSDAKPTSASHLDPIGSPARRRQS
jgi:hypothetical protein